MAKPSTTNCPRLSFVSHSFSCIVCCSAMKIDTSTKRYILFYSCFACEDLSTPLSGGYSGRVPPLPIPNREVKPACADGTAMQCGRVGSRLLLSRASDFERFLRLFCFHAVLLSYRSFIPQITRLLLSFHLFGPGFCKCV